MTSATSAASLAPWRHDASVIGYVGLAHASSHFSHLLLPLMFPAFAKEFGLGFAELGLLSSVFFVISGVGQALMGFVVDRFGARPLMFIAMTLFTLGCGVAALAQNYATLMVAAALFGLGNSSFHPVDFTILNQRVSTPRLGYAYSVHGLTGNLGWALAPIFMFNVAQSYDWHTAYWAAAVVYVVIIALLVWQKDLLVTHVVKRKHDEAQEHSMAFLKIPVIWWCFFFFFFSTMTLAVVQNFVVSILQHLYEVTLHAATMTLTAYLFCAALGMFVGGFVAARFNHQSDRVVALCMLIGAICMALCASTWLSTDVTLVVLALTGLAIGVGGPSRDMMIKKATPKGATGRVYGMVYSGLDVGFAVSPLIFGYFMDHGWFAAALLGAAVSLILSVGVALGVGKRTVASN